MPFTPKELNAAVQKALSQPQVTIPDGHHGASLLIVNEHSATLVAAQKVNDHWTVAGQVEVEKHGHLQAGVTVQGTW